MSAYIAIYNLLCIPLLNTVQDESLAGEKFGENVKISFWRIKFGENVKILTIVVEV